MDVGNINLEDIWYCIYSLSDIIDIGESKLEIAIPTKVAYSAFLKVLKNRESSLSCMICGGITVLHICDEDQCENCYDQTGMCCITTEGYYFNGAKWCMCRKCECYHCLCKCGHYCKLHLHPGWFIQPGPKTTYKNDMHYSNQHDNDDGYYLLSDESRINYISPGIAFATGPDGGMSHEWKCINKDCDEYNDICGYTDK